MNFRPGYGRDEPEINLIPLIDVLLVILIFVMVTTTYSHFSELQINLPTGQGEPVKPKPAQITVLISKVGEIHVAGKAVPLGQANALSEALKRVAQQHPDTVVVVDADALASYQSVVSVMEAAHQAGLTQLTFATRTPGS